MGTCADGRATSATGKMAVDFDLIELHAHNRLALFVAKRHQRSRAYGWRKNAAAAEPLGA